LTPVGRMYRARALDGLMNLESVQIYAVMGGWRGCRFVGRRGICLPLKRVEAVYAVKALELSTDRQVEVEFVRIDDVVGGL
jgi:hypothetical protein